MSSNAHPAIRTDFERVPPELVTRAKAYQAAIFSDVAGRRGALDGRIRALGAHMKICGPAFTVEVRPGDNLMFHAALANARPGDVIVVDGKADRTVALCGALMSAQARAAGIAGFVVDAAVRDSDELAGGDFPIFSVGTNPNGPTKGLGGRVNWPISAGGVAIDPGDLILGDADGVVAIPREQVEALLDLAEKKVQAEAKRMREISEGKLKAPWLEDALKAAGVI
ncbi:RraA family protein [Bordetella genomosp. 13]|uniref:RraA family protein n=1 Tax=Bordetella genomosp. 13 TaxID=463040 RepID=UPI0011A253DE|nr:RraA family protein [Bordetella genomosp. 13]